MDDSATAHEPVASTSRAVFHLPYRPTEATDEDDHYGPDELWFRLYEQAWARTSTRIHRTLASLHDASLDSIVSFVDDSRTAGSTLLATLAGRTSLRTGLIVGANPTTSPLLFSALCRQLTRPHLSPRARSTSVEEMDVDGSPAAQVEPSAESASKQRHSCIVSRLTSRECGNIKVAMRSLISGFIGGAPDLDDEDEDDGPVVATSKLKSATLPPEDMQNLTAWFAHRYRRPDRDAAREEPTLVVLLEDLEGMDGKVLGLMFETLSRFVTKLPLVFLLGVATSADALNQVLWRGVTNLLDTASFFVEPGIGTFNALMRGLFVDWEAPLALGPKAFVYLTKTFEETHHSIDATVSALQSMYMTHYRSKPQAFVNFTVTSEILPSLPDKLFRVLSRLPSLQGATSENADIAAMLASDENGDDDDQGLVFMRGIEECRRLRKAWQNDRRVGVEMLEAMMDVLEKRWSTEKMLLALEEGTLSTFSDELCAMVLHSTSAKLPRFLFTLITRLRALLEADPSLTLEPGLAADSTASEALSEAGTPSPDTPSRAAELLDTLSRVQDDLSVLLEKPKTAGRINLVNDNIPGASLMYPPGSLTETDKEYSKMTKEISDLLRSNLSRAFRPCTSLLLHEVWFSDDLHPLRRFHPAFLPSFQRTLRGADSTFAAEADAVAPNLAEDDAEAVPLSSSPVKSKQAKDKGKGKAKEQEEGSILAGGPSLDVAVAYRLYKETGKTINLGDWWTAFESAAWDEAEAVGDGQNGGGKGKKRKRPSIGSSEDEEEEDSDDDDAEDSAKRRKQARFLRAVGDLAYCGFVQPTTRKQEHVLKSVF